MRSQADARGEYRKIGLEIALYHGKLLQRSLILFLIGFVLAALGWLGVRAKLPYRASTVMLLLGAAALVTAIVLRCMIRSRPPVSTLYETVLFITAVSVIVGMSPVLRPESIVSYCFARRLSLGCPVASRNKSRSKP